MKCAQVAEFTADYLNGVLDDAVRSNIAQHLESCVDCRDQLRAARETWTQLGTLPVAQPSPALRLRVQALIQASRQELAQPPEESASASSLWRYLTGWWCWKSAFQFAMGAALFMGGFLLRPVMTGSLPGDPALPQLQAEVGELRRLVTLNLLRQPEASERIEGVRWSTQNQTHDAKVLEALLQALESDPSVNVRVAAVGSLGQFASSRTVKTRLLQILAKDDAPMVQIELIDLMVRIHDQDAVPILQRLTQNPTVNLAVRQQAEWGLKQLI
jgi:hypothetical protein